MQLSVFEMVKKGVSTTIDIVDSFARTKIDELNASLGAKQNIADNALATTAKTIVGAINEHENDILEINASLGAKQNIADNALDTTAKTIVGAINEHENDILKINSDLTNNTGKLNTLINTNHLDRLACSVQSANFQFNPRLQALEFFVQLESNVWLLIQFRATTISYLVSNDNKQTWTKYWEK